MRQRSRPSTSGPVLAVPAGGLRWLVFGLVAACCGPSPADTFRENFDGDAVTWQVETGREAPRPFDHRRQRHLVHEGKAAEIVKWNVGQGGRETALSHPLPSAAVIEDLRLSVWVRSNQPSLQLRMRLVFPDDLDPETNRPLTTLLNGDRYTTPGEWQELTCTASRELVQEAVRRARYRIGRSDLGDLGLYVDQAVLSTALSANPTEVIVDDLVLANVFPATKLNELVAGERETAGPASPVEFRLSHLQVEGQPFFPTIAKFHAANGETAADFASAGLNVAWIDDYRDDALLTALHGLGIWATAVPPRPEDDEGRPLDPREAGIPPFGPETRAILFWNLGPRVKPEWLEEVIGWVNQLRAADGGFRRPILADVTGSEYAFSRHVDMLAESRHITNTAISYRDYRDWMRSCRTGAFLDTFFWTWAQTEPAEKTALARAEAGHLPVVVEPEQIRQQVYAALQSGCRGIGYWLTTPLGADGPGAEERRLAIARLNLELELLEPLLATGTPGGKSSSPIAFNVTPPNPGSSGLRTRPSYHQLSITGPKPADSPFAPSARPPGAAEAVLLGTDFGPLLVAVWYGEGAQFCPGPMAAPNVSIVVPGVHETAAGYLLTPTDVKLLSPRSVAGGRQITIPKFDQTAVVLFTSDQAVVNRFRRRAAELAARCAQVSLDLAKAKRQRVAGVHSELMSMGAGAADIPPMLHAADRLIADAETALQRNQYDTARQAADDASQSLRNLQRAHWEDAVRQFASPLASPHALCFSTLPDHYRLIAKIGRGVMTTAQEPNLLSHGDFEADVESLLNEGWRHLGTSSETVATNAYTEPAAPKQGRQCLRLTSRHREGMTLPRGTSDSFVSVQSPPIPVTAGQVLHVSGWVRIDNPVPSHFDGVKLHDSLLGPSSGLRWTATNGWQRFEMLREVPADGDFSITMTLQGVGDGDAYFDDLRVVAVTPRTQIAEQPSGRGPTRR